MNIEKANSDDHEILTEITKKSKAFWGYSEEQMTQWNDALTITKDYIQTNFAYKLIQENQVIGYYSYFNSEAAIIKLDNLFILPEYIGKGFGNQLMQDFLNRIKENCDIKKIVLDADPNAEKFYQKFGFKTIGQLETSIKNRFLPIMELNLLSHF
ncbi:GNAT family N-acetyltransferase [Flavobacterium sp.]|uniref:GNAT family N-acetyltransferase n=1 Tax=Flavobacterium sp. TaxID=239 RepID=UPI000EEEEB36|nr:GNAT family N-acetyltransferase [Flavobacterium sp.]HCQ13397.1 GNAT family N-acetyltransferase [Flavobacterium sp.]